MADHFEHPRNVGEIDAPDATARAGNPVCGDEVTVTLRVSDGVVREMRFRAFGCHATVAATSLLSERVAGRTVAEAMAVSTAELRGWFEAFPAGKGHAAEVAIDALRRALGGS